MVRINGGFSNEENAVSASLSDSLLFTTMCIVGLSVDVHVKDGSIISGIFYTASVDDDYAIVLKKARMIKKGNLGVNIVNGGMVETLLVQAEDLVQLVAKGVPVTENGILADFGGDEIRVVASNIQFPDSEVTSMKQKVSSVDKKQCNMMRQVGDALGIKQSDNEVKSEYQGPQIDDALHGSSSDRDAGENISAARDEAHANTEFPFDVLSSATDKLDDQSNKKDASAESPRSNVDLGVSTDATLGLHETRLGSSNGQNKSAPPKTSICNKPAKDSKLNPGAKVFSPSPHHQKPMTPAVPTVPSVTYTPDPSLMVSVAGSQPDYETSSIDPLSSTPVKFVPYNNLVNANNATDLQYSHFATGYAGNRVQPVRFAGPYHHFQAASAFGHPHSQNIMVGRMGPLVYLQPLAHDLQGAAGFSQLSMSPLFSQYQVHLPKHQGICNRSFRGTSSNLMVDLDHVVSFKGGLRHLHCSGCEMQCNVTGTTALCGSPCYNWCTAAT